MTNEELKELEVAVYTLEFEDGVLLKVMNFVGKVADKSISKLPTSAIDIIHKGTKKGLKIFLKWGLVGFNKQALNRSPSNYLHKGIVFVSGGIGGFVGLKGAVIELPITTTIMLRSIADVARANGEDLNNLESQLACIQVFGLEGGKKSDDDADIGFYVLREGLELIINNIVKNQGNKMVAQFIEKFMATIASRFGAVMAEKVAAQLIPVIGSAGAATINIMFMNYYQDMAKAFFTIRRLERKYGYDTIRQQYERLMKEYKGKGLTK